MPIIVEGLQGPTGWEQKRMRPSAPSGAWDARAASVQIALVNNMPDAALEETESQFAELLGAASDDLLVRMKLFSLPHVPRGEAGQQRLCSHYFGIEELWRSQFDAVIITGTEPRQADLRREPYWAAMADVLEWAHRNTASAVMSCLAAHASVLHNDGIQRRPREEKLAGVFDFQANGGHALTEQAGGVLRFPQSRWNELEKRAIEACGYNILAESAEAGIDLFVKKTRKSLFVHFQGHPEYGKLTILKEYRRDVRRFLKQERDEFPSMPQGYLDGITVKVLTEFRKKALAQRSPELMAEFPESLVSRNLRKTWSWTATSVYRNWLQYVAGQKSENATLAPAGHTQSAAAL